MKTRLLAAAAFALMLASPSLAQQMSAEGFATTAASSDMFEITSSSLARERATSEAVRDFANMMIADHTQASSELAAAAETAGVALPGGMIDKHAAQVETLKGLQGAEFDAAYIEAQTAAHEEALALMEGYAESGDNEALKAHAQKTAPIIERHAEHVKELGSGG